MKQEEFKRLIDEGKVYVSGYNIKDDPGGCGSILLKDKLMTNFGYIKDSLDRDDLGGEKDHGRKYESERLNDIPEAMKKRQEQYELILKSFEEGKEEYYASDDFPYGYFKATSLEHLLESAENIEIGEHALLYALGCAAGNPEYDEGGAKYLAGEKINGKITMEVE